MLLGKVSGKTTTKTFSFYAETRVKKLDYLTFKDAEGHWILAIADNVTTEGEKVLVSSSVIGYKDKRGFLKPINSPIAPETPIYSSETSFIKQTLGIPESGLYMGLLEGYTVKVHLPIEHLIKKHVAVLAKTGAGKSYVTGVLLEELAENSVPAVVIDPHGEYSTLKKQNRRSEELKFLDRFGIQPKSYKDKVKVFYVGSSTNQLKLSSKLTPEQLFDLLPAKPSPSQQGLLYSAIRSLEGRGYTLRDVIDEISASKSNAKWSLISMLEALDNTKLFSSTPTKPEEIVQKGTITIIDLKEAKPEVQQMAVLKMVEDLFDARKQNKVPSFLLVVEEAHTFCPERGFGEVASSKVLRTIASEGRKFGFGLAIITQRPARVDKNVLSQANTQIILKVTNPNDLKAITESVEGITAGTKEEIKDLPVGIAMIVGVTEYPLLTSIRIRRSEHGGSGMRITEKGEEPRERTLLFESKVTQSKVEKDFKELEDIRFLHYPVWRLAGEFNNSTLDFHVDGISGEVIFSTDKKIQRSSGVKTILNLPPSSRLIILHLAMNKAATVDKIAGDLSMPQSTVKTQMNDLVKNGHVTTDGFMYKNNIVLDFPTKMSLFRLNSKPAEGEITGHMLGFMVSEDFARKASELWGIKAKKAESVYYPYWLVKYKGKKVLIDAITSQIDVEASKAVQELV